LEHRKKVFLKFDTFGLHPSVAAGAAAAGYETPTPIQSQAIPQILAGRDVMGLAQTGTGKTAAFVLPILNRLINGPRGTIRALIIAPTRELAEQIKCDFKHLGRLVRLGSTAVYGGVGINPQIKGLKHADIVVSCPGRLLDHINRRTVDLSRLEVLVLDEADQLFDMGFMPDIRRILKHVPKVGRQTLLFSATMPTEIRRLANEVLRDATTVQIGATAPAKTVRHVLYPVATHLKTALLIRLLDQTREGSVLVFTRTKHRAKNLDKKLAKAGYRSTSLQGNLSQGKRQAALTSFRTGESQILVATDIAARGLDISNVSHVINYDIPATLDAYIHRIGRTGRAQHSGKAFTFITDDDTKMVSAINRAIGSSVEQRTLSDFNYGTPFKSRGNRVASSASRSPRNRTKRFPKSGTKRRGSKGVFVWQS
jgi:ATP-dependent RNA helicase RhlE